MQSQTDGKCHRKCLFLALVILELVLNPLSCLGADIFPGEFTYSIKKGKNIPVCQHMVKVYNKHFRHYWSDNDLSPEMAALIEAGCYLSVSAAQLNGYF